MSQNELDTVQEEIAKDIYEIAAFYKEEINRIMQEFDKHDIDTSVQLDHVEAERVSKTPGLRAPETSQIGPSTEQAHQENYTEEDTDDDDDDAGESWRIRASELRLERPVNVAHPPPLSHLHEHQQLYNSTSHSRKSSLAYCCNGAFVDQCLKALGIIGIRASFLCLFHFLSHLP